MAGLLDILAIARKAAIGSKLAVFVQRAAQGDPAAIAYLKEQGWQEALDIFLRPGAGELGKGILYHGQEAARGVTDLVTGQSSVIDAEWRDVGPPWMDFLGWLRARRWGTFVVLGPKGGGKSTLAVRLAQVWQEQTHWPVLMVNAYPEERLDWVRPMQIAAFAAELKAILKLLDKPEQEEPDEHGETWGLEDLDRALEHYKRRIVVIDEMSLAVSPSGQDPARHLMRQIMAQARHLNWLIVYIGQLVRMLPQDLLGSDAVFIKKPTGRESLVDRQEPLTIDFWQRAAEAFRHLTQAPAYDQYPNPKSWAYADCPDMGGGRSYRGLMCFSVPWLEQTESEEVTE